MKFMNPKWETWGVIWLCSFYCGR